MGCKMVEYVMFAAILVPLIYLLYTNFELGVCFSVFLLVSLSPSLKISTAGALPELTIFRAILLVVFFFWFINNTYSKSIRSIPFMKFIKIVIFTNIFILIFAVDFTTTLKEFISFLVEVVLFYVILSSTIKTREQSIRLLTFIVYGLGTVALLAIIERFTGFNPVDSFVPGYFRDGRLVRNILSTYPHRILLGTALAMGWPLSIALQEYYKNYKFKKNLFKIFEIALVIGCYYSFSRGPWLAAFFASVLLFYTCSVNVKKKVLLIGLLAGLVFLIRPGVQTTLVSSYQTTFQEDSFKRGTYLYRWELWKKAYFEIRKSTSTTFFGYGMGSHHVLNLEGTISYEEGVIATFWSWDNYFALLLFEKGLIGFGAVILLYSMIMLKLYSVWRHSDIENRNVIACINASMMALLFMMSNVSIYAPQLFYLFWSLLCIGLAYTGNTEAQPIFASQPSLKNSVPSGDIDVYQNN